MRLISCSLTESAIRDATKDVTRRLGWLNLKVGERLMFCRKIMGRRKGEPLVRIREIEVVSVRRERLDKLTEPAYGGRWTVYGADECRREGFPQMTPDDFVKFFCASHSTRTKKHPKGCTPQTEVTRIEFKYVGAVVTPRVSPHDLPLAQPALDT